MESAEYKKQYDEYLARAEKALSQACERYLPEGSDVCRAARYRRRQAYSRWAGAGRV